MCPFMESNECLVHNLSNVRPKKMKKLVCMALVDISYTM